MDNFEDTRNNILLEIYQIYTANSHFFGVGPGTDLV
jgi:hypothetical protein